MLVALLLASAAPAAAGNLQFGWGNCAGEPASGWVLNFDCAGGSPAPAFATFQLDGPVAGVVLVAATIDLWMMNSASVPPFWRMEPGGCNAGGVEVADARGLVMGAPMAACVGASTTFQGATGELTDAFVTFAPGLGGENRARMSVEVARPGTSPAALAWPPAQHFAWRLDWLMDAAAEAGGACDGCRQNVSLVLGEVVLEGRPEDGELARLRGTDPGSLPDLCLNPGACLVDPVVRRTWGRLKALYR